MKVAVIDCGTNTFNLLIIQLTEGKKYEKLLSTRIPVRLGQDTINEGIIAEVPFMRGIDAISTFKHHIKKHNVQKVLAFATSAIREASNGDVFVKEVFDLFDIEITVIDGNREAELIYIAIKEAVQLKEEVSLILDIGGGSNEFILANRNEIFWKQSFLIGASRLLQKFPHSSPITEQEKEDINKYLNEQLQDLFRAAEKFPPCELIGSSGSFESVIEMINGELNGEPLSPEKTEYHVRVEDNEKISEIVFNCTVEERKQIKGLIPMRIDMIVISCLMVKFIMDSFKLRTLRVSTYSLKEGALIDYLDNLNITENG